jgi:Aminoglycoside-2''-adenylyltransferase
MAGHVGQHRAERAVGRVQRVDRASARVQPAVLGLYGLTSTSCRLPPLKGPWQTGAVNERMTAQLRIIRAVVNALDAAGISAWLFGGWGLDARIGRITREHGDVEFWVERTDAGRSKAVLTEAGATALATQPPRGSVRVHLGRRRLQHCLL